MGQGGTLNSTLSFPTSARGAAIGILRGMSALAMRWIPNTRAHENMNAFERKFQVFLSHRGWWLSERGDLVLWCHADFTGRRFDTACAVIEALKQVPKLVIV